MPSWKHRPVLTGAFRFGSTGFFWGLTLGVLAASVLVLALDRGWEATPPAPAVAGGAPVSSPEVRASVFLAGGLPPGTNVFVDGQAMTVTPEAQGLRVPIPRGARRLEVRGRNGTWWSTRLAANASTGDTLRPALGGELVLQVEPYGPSGGVFLDGKLLGSAPGSISDAPPGWHVVSIRKGDAVLYEDACEIQPGKVTVLTVPALPAKGKGRIVVRARILHEDGFQNQDGSPVWLDGDRAGSTPVDLDLRAGFHSVRVERPGFTPLVEVMYLEAGRARYVNADFGQTEVLSVQVQVPAAATRGVPLALPVVVEAGGESVLLKEAGLELIREGQAHPMHIPLVASRTDTRLWVGVIPAEAVSGPGGALSGYAACVDESGRRGFSEIFDLPLRASSSGTLTAP